MLEEAKSVNKMPSCPATGTEAYWSDDSPPPNMSGMLPTSSLLSKRSSLCKFTDTIAAAASGRARVGVC